MPAAKASDQDPTVNSSAFQSGRRLRRPSLPREMHMTTTRSAAKACLACALILAATCGAFAREGIESGTLVQYCAPPDNWELHRIICRDRG
jgi:hypothetical protein